METSLPPELVDNYRRRRKADLATLEAALASGDAEPFQRIGHQLSGNARSYGFPELENLGRRMEAMPAQELASAGPSFLRELAAWVAGQERA